MSPLSKGMATASGLALVGDPIGLDGRPEEPYVAEAERIGGTSEC